MGMRIEKSFRVQASADQVWAFLIDPHKVASCLPGAAITGEVDAQTFNGTMNVKVGPVQAAYKGRMRFERLDTVAREAEIAASGQETRGKGAADMRMTSRVVAIGPAETEVHVTSDVNVVGVLAQFGRGMIQDVSDQMFEKFTQAMRRQLEPASAGAAAAVSGAPAVAAAASGAPQAPAAPAAPQMPVAPGGAVTPPAAPALPDAALASASAPLAAGGAVQAMAAAVPAVTATAAPSPAAAAAPAPASPPPAAPSPATTPAPARPPEEDVLDLGAIGAVAAGRAVGRTLRSPVFWVVVVLLTTLLWILL